jgi:hypothetical protein
LVVTYAGWNVAGAEAQVAGFVQQVVVSDGLCTLTMTMSGTVRTTTKDATPNVGNTQCGTLSIAAAQLTAGTWSAVLRFTSPEISGSAAPVAVIVP